MFVCVLICDVVEVVCDYDWFVIVVYCVVDVLFVYVEVVVEVWVVEFVVEGGVVEWVVDYDL